MNPEPNDTELEKQLAALTEWSGRTPELWRKALAGAGPSTARGHPMMQRVLRAPVPVVLATSVGIVIIGAVVSALLTATAQDYPRAETNAKSLGTASSVSAAEWNNRQFTLSRDDFGYENVVDKDGDGIGGEGSGGFGAGGPQRVTNGMMGSGVVVGIADADVINVVSAAASFSASVPTTGADDSRQVVRKANIALATHDVRAAFLKAMQLISEARSEYVQDSSLTGEGRTAQANLTLRVAADRLPEVLNQLRPLGKVMSESATGEDVTAQIVDLEARLRNEQRVEQDLLQLMDKRADAPLKEILDLRDHISQVRQTIEQLTGLRERVGRLVSLATILVLIRADEQPPEPPKQQGIGDYFGQSITTSWDRSLRHLADSLGGAMRMIVGGLLWWGAVIAVIVAIHALIRRRLIARPAAAG